MRVYFDALGCPKALVDAEKIASIVQNAENEIVLSPADAEIIIINTCGFIETAKQESINSILEYTEMKKDNPGLKVVVSGCLTERYRNELWKSIPEIDSMIGARDIGKILDALSRKSEDILDQGEYREYEFDGARTPLFSGNRYAYLKISEGCARQCAFCAIPAIRGPLRSRSIEDILNEAKFLREEWDVRELILVSEDTSAYGQDRYGKKRIIALLEKLIEMDFDWIRLLYLFPDEIVGEIAGLMTRSDKICRYIDIPLQHASGRILRAMNRPGDAESYLSMIEGIRAKVPDAAVRTAFIVGFPGEDDSDHKALAEFLKQARFDRVGFFEYSDEDGTPAYAMTGKTPVSVIRRRIEELSRIQEGISAERLAGRVGMTLKCINDGTMMERGETMTAVFRSQYEAPEIDGNVVAEIEPGDVPDEPFYQIRITNVLPPHDLEGVIIEP
ncbi:MAG: 30S ribosomal protein S12 methylthiotransferase RimO [Brevinematales bacterium]|nr:30S ribosomal protein S12 methylthiotransferase RimO [Brevinematales bacterium]